MYKRILQICCLLSVFSNSISAQNSADESKDKKGSFYILWGYNKEWYTKSTMHFQNNGDPNKQDQFGVYDFKVYDVEASDRAGFKAARDLVNFTIPQFGFRIGYYLNNKRNDGIELNYDHAKYVMNDFQTLHVKGTILGQNVDKDSLLDPALFHVEHTDGANFWHINYIRRFDLFKNSPANYKFKLIVKAGGGFVMPRTDVTLFGKRINNNWKVAGVCAGLETGLRTELWKHFVIETTGKLEYANYINCLVQGKGNGKLSQQFGCVEVIASLGYQF